MRISDWSSDVCSSDLAAALGKRVGDFAKGGLHGFFVSRDGHLLRSPGIFEIARTAAEVEQRQRGAGRAGVGIAAVLEQARQRGAQGAERARQRDRGEERSARRAEDRKRTSLNSSH